MEMPVIYFIFNFNRAKRASKVATYEDRLHKTKFGNWFFVDVNESYVPFICIDNGENFFVESTRTIWRIHVLFIAQRLRDFLQYDNSNLLDWEKKSRNKPIARYVRKFVSDTLQIYDNLQRSFLYTQLTQVELPHPRGSF